MALFESATNIQPQAQVPSQHLREDQAALMVLGNRVMRIDVPRFVSVSGFIAATDHEPTTSAASSVAILPLDLPQDWEVLAIEAQGLDSKVGGGAATVSLERRLLDNPYSPVSIINTFTGSPSRQGQTGLTATVADDTSFAFFLKTPGSWSPGIFTVWQIWLTLRRVAPVVPPPV